MRRTTRSSAASGLSPAATASASSSATVGNSCEDLPLAPGDLGGEPVLAQQHAEHEGDQAEDQQRHRALRRRQPRRARTARPRSRRRTRPQITCSTRNWATSVLQPGTHQPPPDRCGAAEHALDHAGPRPDSSGPKTPAKALADATGSRQRVAGAAGRARRAAPAPRAASGARRGRPPRPATARTPSAAPSRPPTNGVTTGSAVSIGSRPMRTISAVGDGTQQPRRRAARRRRRRSSSAGSPRAGSTAAAGPATAPPPPGGRR